jgi:hypothetical protein
LCIPGDTACLKAAVIAQLFAKGIVFFFIDAVCSQLRIIDTGQPATDIVTVVDTLGLMGSVIISSK